MTGRIIARYRIWWKLWEFGNSVTVAAVARRNDHE